MCVFLLLPISLFMVWLTNGLLTLITSTIEILETENTEWLATNELITSTMEILETENTEWLATNELIHINYWDFENWKYRMTGD